MMEKPWTDFDEIREQSGLLIVPTGAVEVYGQHLPTGTDSIVVTHIARQVGEQLGAPVMPTIPIGFSRSLGDFPGTLNVSPATFTSFVLESVESVLSWGSTKRVLFINTHRGNIAPINDVAMELQDRHEVICAQVFWWDYVSALVEDIVDTGPHANGHASEIGTSIMLYLEPDLVVRERIKDQTPSRSMPFADIVQYNGMSARSATGVVGNPEAATAEKGAEMVRRGVGRIIEFVQQEFSG